MNDSDIVKDFLQESSENLDRLDRELVDLEKNPRDAKTLASVFRTVHTIKGTCGFLGGLGSRYGWRLEPGSAQMKQAFRN